MTYAQLVQAQDRDWRARCALASEAHSQSLPRPSREAMRDVGARAAAEYMRTLKPIHDDDDLDDDDDDMPIEPVDDDDLDDDDDDDDDDPEDAPPKKKTKPKTKKTTKASITHPRKETTMKEITSEMREAAAAMELRTGGRIKADAIIGRYRGELDASVDLDDAGEDVTTEMREAAARAEIMSGGKIKAADVLADFEAVASKEPHQTLAQSLTLDCSTIGKNK